MSTIANLYAEKAASAEKELNAARNRLAGASPATAPAIQREITVLEAMLPLFRAMKKFLASLPEAAAP